jgi:hypothetical protein
MTTKRYSSSTDLAELLEQRMAELRDELAAAQRERVSAAEIQRAAALFDPVWDPLRVPERFGLDSLAAESAMAGQPFEDAA